MSSGVALYTAATPVQKSALRHSSNMHWLAPTAVGGPKINTNDEPILRGGVGWRHDAYVHTGIVPWVERVGNIAASIWQRAVHNAASVC